MDLAAPLTALARCPRHAPTPLLRRELDGVDLWLEDESARMGLGAFKALGGVYALLRLLEARLGPFADSAAWRAGARAITFVCASAGNHGMAGAKLFGARARVHLAAPAPEGFAERLRATGAEVVRSGDRYEASIAAAIADADARGAIHLADGSWPGFLEPPRLVMEGYTAIADELRARFEAEDAWPDRVYLQAGVGGLAAAMAYAIRESWRVQPELVVCEPEAAPCLKASAVAGAPRAVEGPISVMGRLDCKEPSILAFAILKRRADRYVTVSDDAALAAAARASSLGFETSASGAAGLAAALADARAGRNLVILSEGAVDD